MLGELEARPALARAFACTVPSGGLALWLRLRRGSIDQLAARARGHGVELTAGSAHLAEGTLAAFRFGFAAHTPEETSRLCDVLETCVAARRNAP